MLEIKNVTKIYKTEGFKQKALDNVSINFRKSEFVSILGPSGSGKTTLLNIIGGLDHYTKGDLIINGTSTKKYNDRDWDSYRNHKVGFVFQNYNLITHQTVLKNVELALTLSGINKEDRKKKAIKALKDVGLEKHVNKKPNELSGGQMQRVAIARALVNDPEIILADEPTGALDSETSIQIMDLLKRISNDKLVIMVTHNPELAEEYSSRIINIKDGKIVSDSKPYTSKNEKIYNNDNKKTNMSFLTALTLSFNNLMTKKARTILVSFAGSIGIIGIALILAVSTGFQNYVDDIGEETLTSYPLTIMQESTDIAGTLLSMRSNSKKESSKDTLKEEQYIKNMLSNVSTNDLKSFKKYLEENDKKVRKDVSNIDYSYSVDPNIYTIDATNKLSKLNPSTLFSSMMGGSSIMSSYSKMSSIYSQMVDNYDGIKNDYEVLKGRWPKKYDEMIIVLSDKNSISDLLVYSLGLRDTEELTDMVTKIMGGEKVNINNKPKTFTYDDLLNVDLRLIMPSDTYKYNDKYNIYEDMSDNNDYMMNLYKNAIKLKVVGIVSSKEGTNSMALQPGVSYRSDLIKHIINYSKNTDIVQNQLENTDVDIFSNTRFDAKKSNFDLNFKDLIKVDNKKLESAFNVKIDNNAIENDTKKYMNEISNSISVDVTPARELYDNNLDEFINYILNNNSELKSSMIDEIINNCLNNYDYKLTEMEKVYVIPKETIKTTYIGLLKGFLSAYITSYNTYMSSFNENYVMDTNDPSAFVIKELNDMIIKSYKENASVLEVSDKMSKAMMEAKVKKEVLTKVGELVSNLSSSFANSFNVDQNKIASAFEINLDEDELKRIVSAMINKKDSTLKSNLITLGYQDLDEPSYISFYFKSFDSKENFMKFLKNYNNKVSKSKKINYTDTTGIIMSSVKTIVNAVSYVLIAFVSISLVVSSIMIGVITYISVYERTKEIGILRSIGASKRNISSIFNAETFIIGFLSGIFGIGISYIMIPIINKVLHHFTGNIPLSASLNFNSAFLLVILSIILTLIGGLIPAKKASKKDPVEALRSE